LAKLTENIAIGKLTKDRILETLISLAEKRDNEVLQATQLLESIKDAYEENKRKINREVKEIQETDIDIMLGRTSINWAAVNQNIENSINWEHVNDLLVKVLTNYKLKKIKESKNDEKKKKFLELANWLKATSPLNSKISTIINNYKKIPPKLPFKLISSEITNTNNKPLYTKYIRYVGLKINIEVIEETSVTFFIKYIKPDGTLVKNPTNPMGLFTCSETKHLMLINKTVILLGVGNANKCTFDVGQHRIEVHVDETPILIKEFNVQVAPSELLELELKKAENKLLEINNAEYFKTEISQAENEMNQIIEWQLLRNRSEKQNQIIEQRKKIDRLLEKAATEKKAQQTNQFRIIKNIKIKLENTEY